jgi:hypothetical protein
MLQPSERLWPLSNEGVASRHFERIEDLEEAIVGRCVALHDQPEVSSATVGGRLSSESIQPGLVLHQIPHDARGSVRLRPLAQRQPRIPPRLVLLALGVFPHHEPVEEHVRREPLLESRTGRQ